MSPTTKLVIPIEKWVGIVDEGLETCSPEELWEVDAHSAKWELYIISSDEVSWESTWIYMSG